MPISSEFFRHAGQLEASLSNGQPERAKTLSAHLWILIQSAPTNQREKKELLGTVGTLLRKAGQFEMALIWYEQVCGIADAIEPHSAKTAWDHAHHAECLAKTGRISEAEAKKRLELASARQRASDLTDEGCFYCVPNEFEKALDIFNQAIAVDATYANAWFSKAGCLFELDRFQEAKDCYRMVLQINPSDKGAKEMFDFLSDAD